MINDLVNEMVSQGVRPVILTGQPNYPDGLTFIGYKWWKIRKEIVNQVEIIRIPLFPRGKQSIIGLALNYISFVFFGLICAPILLRNYRFDKIFVFGVSPILSAIPGIFLKKVMGAKLCLWVLDLWPESLRVTGYVRSPLLLNCVRLLVKWIYSQSDLILVQSRSFISEVAKLASVAKVRYYPSSFQLKQGDKSPIGWSIDAFKTNKQNIIFAGNIGKAQSVETILYACARLKQREDFQISIFGSGSMLDQLKIKASELGLNNIFFYGRVPIESMPDIYGLADAFIVTLKKDDVVEKTLPWKVQSYLAAGKPILACGNGEIEKVICESKSGLVCAAEDSEALANLIVEFLSASANQRGLWADNAKSFFLKNFDLAVNAERLLIYLREMEQS